MSKRRRKAENHIQPSPQLVNEMRGIIHAARPSKGLRSLTPTQAQNRINGLLSETVHELNKVSKRKIPQGEVLRAQVSGRRPATESRVLRKRMPAPLLDFFQGAERALVCSKRETRREVMHAMRRTGKAGARRNRKARWSSSSRLTCKGR